MKEICFEQKENDYNLDLSVYINKRWIHTYLQFGEKNSSGENTYFCVAENHLTTVSQTMKYIQKEIYGTDDNGNLLFPYENEAAYYEYLESHKREIFNACKYLLSLCCLEESTDILP